MSSIDTRLRWTVLLATAAGLLAPLVACKNITSGKADPGTIGATCDPDNAKEDCDEVEEPVCLKMEEGYCSSECAGSGIFDCSTESVCEQLGDRAFFCLDGCLTENRNGDCRDDYRCSARPDVINLDGREVGVCMPQCKSDADCEDGRRCDSGSGDCVPRGEKKTGDACRTNQSCNGGLCVQSESFPGGYCSARCGSHLTGCEPGSQCIDLEGEALCLSSCRNDEDCRQNEKYKCRQFGTRKDSQDNDQPIKVCVPKCQANDECADGFHCDFSSGDCVEGVADDPNPVGAFCGANDDCESGDCITNEGWPNGYCTAGCDAGCGDGTACGSTVLGDRCLTQCEADLDCRVGYVCADGGCNARCRSDEDCGDDLRCSSSTGRCEERGGSGSETIEVEVASGVRVRGALSEELTLDVPDDVRSFSILASGQGADLMVIGELRDPTGRMLYDFQDPFGSEVRFFPSDDIITQTVPTSPRSAPVPGTYKFKLIKDGAEARIDVRALVKTSAGDAETGALDINFFFANVSGIDADTAPGNGPFQDAVDTLRNVYAEQGIEVGETSYCNLESADAGRFASVDDIEGPSSELSQMFKLSEDAAALGCDASDRALNFFMVQEIVGGRAGYIILGIAGGIPGPPPGVNGNTHAGVAVTMLNFQSNPVQLGQTMAHEGGHFLGLFHTTEAEGNAFDPLPDTPECRNNNDRNGDGLVSYDECLNGKGAENLMFWAAGDDASDVSNDQGFVLLRNPGIK